MTAQRIEAEPQHDNSASARAASPRETFVTRARNLFQPFRVGLWKRFEAHFPSLAAGVAEGPRRQGWRRPHLAYVQSLTPRQEAGADAGKEFSRLKQARGFNDSRKAFHSFRNNVTRIMERNRVPENERAQVFGHEKGFTYGRYKPDGITLAQKAAIIDRITYPGVSLPEAREDIGEPSRLQDAA